MTTTFSKALYSEIVSSKSSTTEVNETLLHLNAAKSSEDLNGVLSNPLTTGENGALLYLNAAKSSEDLDGLLSEVFLLMRGESQSVIELKISKAYTSINKNKIFMIKFVKLCLFMREPRKGKGERMIFYRIVDWFWKNDNNIAKYLIKRIHEFGCYTDYCKLYELTTSPTLKDHLVEIYGKKLIEDLESTTPSLAGKWAPREQSKYREFAKKITDKFFNNNKKKYRCAISALNKKLCVPEVNMCKNTWSTIDFKNVSSNAFTIYSKAFQNMPQNPFPKNKRIKMNPKSNSKVILLPKYTPGNPIYEDRMTCKSNLNEFLKKKSINSTVANLTNIVEKYLKGSVEDIVFEAQWNARVDEIKKMLKELNLKPKILPMIDLSGSMEGEPMYNAITLGFFTSLLLDNELNEEESEFANIFLTFNTVPEIGKLERGASFYKKIKSLKDNGWLSKWGGSTNIKCAFEIILQIAVKHDVKEENMPQVLAIFSDMQFNNGDSSWNETSYEMMNRMFKEKSYKLPHIIFWNLRSSTVGYQVRSDYPNVTMLSGYSTRMLDLFLTGSLSELVNESVNQSVKVQQPSTLSLIEKIYENKMFDEYNEEICQLFD